MVTVVSIVSGKGGSGKSLLTAVLGRALAREGDRVLIVDMDIFVRGLTVLLFGFKRPERKEGSITVSDLLGVFPDQSKGKGPASSDIKQYMIQRFFECDVLPAVDNISAPLDYDDKSLSDEAFCNKCVRDLLSSVQGEYDYVLLDNRAGMDSLIAATCKNAQIVLAIAEDDEVGRQTNVNLTRFLQSKKSVRIVYTIINKGRNIRNYSDVRERARQRPDYSMLGVIPFDMDVLEEFGSDRFWATVMETLYFRAILDAWNTLAKNEHIRELAESKYRFPPKIFMQKSQGRYTLLERTFRVYSIVFVLCGAFFWFYGEYRRDGKVDLFQMSSVLSILGGVLFLVLSTSGFQALIRGQARERDEKSH
jgi:septum site-determining protein MinD